MEANEQLGIDADLKVTARNPETGEEFVLIDTEAGIEPEDAEIEVIKEETNNDDQSNERYIGIRVIEHYRYERT